MKEKVFDTEELRWIYSLYKQAPIAIGVFLGDEYTINLANPLMCGIWGRSEEEVLNRPVFTALPEFKDQGFVEIFNKVFTTGELFEGSGVPAVIHKEGKEILCFFNTLYKPLLNSDNEIIGIIQISTEVTDLILSKKRAERNEEIIGLALENSKIGTWYMNLISGETERSVEHDRIMGYPEPLPEWDPEMFFEKVLPEDLPGAKEGYEHGLEKGHIAIDARIRWPDNSIHWVSIKGKTSYNLSKQPIFISGVIIDVTEQKKVAEKERQLAIEHAAREEAERQKQMLEQLFMDAPALICTLRGPEHVFTLVNPAYQNQLFPGRELLGKPILEALPELEGQPFVETLNEVFSTGETYIGNEVPLQFDRGSNGELEIGYFNFVYQAHKNAEGEITGILVFAFEITEQIKTRKLAEKSEQSLTLALEAGNMGTWYLDLVKGGAVHSKEHDLIFGYDAPIPDWDFNKFIRHVLPEDKPDVIKKFQLAEGAGSLSLETRIISANESIKWILIKGKIFYESEKPVGMAGVVMDITQRKEGEWKLQELTTRLANSNRELKAANQEVTAQMEKLSRANKQLKHINSDLDNFVYTASHDLKAPISNIEGLTRMLIRQLPHEIKDEAIFNKILSSIETSIDRFKHTIIELTDIAKLQKQIDDLAVLDLGQVVNEVILDMETAINESKAEIIINFNTCELIRFSYKNLKSIIYNLVSNAIKYRAPGRTPKITISCNNEKDGFISLAVADNGLGIRKKDLSKIFSIYKRLHTHVEGTGIGLYLVKRIIDNAEGRIEVESKENVGSTFKIYLPAVKT